MQWDSLSTAIALWALIVASIALWNGRRAMTNVTAITAAIARHSSELSRLSAERGGASPLTPSQLAELAELRDAIDKGNALLKRINSRETMRERRERLDPTNVDPAQLKAHLRRVAGLTAGRPANHNEGKP